MDFVKLNNDGVGFMYNSANIAERIKNFCKATDIQLKDMFIDLNLNKNTMSNMYNGSMIKADSLAKIADYLNCSVDYLMGRTNIVNSNITPNQNTQLTEHENKILSAYRQNPNMQGAVNRLLGVEPPMRAIKIARSNTSRVTEITGDFSDLLNAPRLEDDDL